MKVKVREEKKFLFVSLDGHGDLRTYHIRGFCAKCALNDLILEIEHPAMEMREDTTWFWNWSASGTRICTLGSWNDLCAWCMEKDRKEV